MINKGVIDMKEARILGNQVQYLANEKGLSISALSQILSCEESQVYALIKGRAFASYAQINKLSEELGTTVESLLRGNQEVYNSTVVHCMNKFHNDDNREKILDIIDGYIDIVDALN